MPFELAEANIPTLIYPSATIREKVIVGAGAVVVKNIIEAGNYVGVLARRF